MIRLLPALCAALRDHLAGGKASPPEAGVPLWNAFMRLSRTRTYHQFGPNPISYREIEAFCRITRLPLEPHHVEIIVAMDEVWLSEAIPKQDKTPDGVKTLPPRSQQPISAALIDAMFG